MPKMSDFEKQYWGFVKEGKEIHYKRIRNKKEILHCPENKFLMIYRGQRVFWYGHDDFEAMKTFLGIKED